MEVGDAGRGRSTTRAATTRVRAGRRALRGAGQPPMPPTKQDVRLEHVQVRRGRRGREPRVAAARAPLRRGGSTCVGAAGRTPRGPPCGAAPRASRRRAPRAPRRSAPPGREVPAGLAVAGHPPALICVDHDLEARPRRRPGSRPGPSRSEASRSRPRRIFTARTPCAASATAPLAPARPRATSSPVDA